MPIISRPTATPLRPAVPVAPALAVMAAAVAACGEAHARTGGLVTTAPAERSDTVFVLHPGESLRTPAPFRVSDAPVFRLGLVDGEAHFQFTNIVDATRLPNRQWAILEGSPPSVRIFDVGGSFVRSMGAQGDGPGEMQLPLGLVPDQAGRLIWWGGMPVGRMAIFQYDDGTVLEDVRFPVSRVGGVVPLDGEQFLLMASTETPGPEGVVEAERTLLRWNPADDEVTEIARGPGGEYEIRRTEGRVQFISNRWYQWHGFSVAGRSGGVWMADGRDWQLRRVRISDGAIDRVIRFDEPRERLEPGLAARVLEAQLARTERAEERESLQRTHDGTEYPDFLPTIRNLRIDGSGRIWMQLSRAERALEPPSQRIEHWVILDDEGDRVVGRLELPLGHRLLYADDEGVLTWFEGDLDVPYVEWRHFVAG